MAAYPVDQGGIGSTFRVRPDAGIHLTSMGDGADRGWTDYDVDHFIVEVTHWWLPLATDCEAIFTFYDANKLLVVSVLTDEGTFDCNFMNRPEVAQKSGPIGRVVSVLRGVKQ